MSGKPPSKLKSVLLVWVIGLSLGIGAGALTAMLLLPSEEAASSIDGTLGERLRGTRF